MQKLRGIWGRNKTHFPHRVHRRGLQLLAHALAAAQARPGQQSGAAQAQPAPPAGQEGDVGIFSGHWSVKLYYFPKNQPKQIYLVVDDKTPDQIMAETSQWKGAKLLYIDCKAIPDPMDKFDPVI